jgi:hypothetical protein
MTRELSTFERQTLTQLDALHLRYVQTEKPEDLLFEINNALSMWSALRGYHIALLGRESAKKDDADG